MIFWFLPRNDMKKKYIKLSNLSALLLKGSHSMFQSSALTKSCFLSWSVSGLLMCSKTIGEWGMSGNGMVVSSLTSIPGGRGRLSGRLSAKVEGIPTYRPYTDFCKVWNWNHISPIYDKCQTHPPLATAKLWQLQSYITTYMISMWVSSQLSFTLDLALSTPS